MDLRGDCWARLAVSRDRAARAGWTAICCVQVVDLGRRRLLRWARSPGLRDGSVVGSERPRASTKEHRLLHKHALLGVDRRRVFSGGRGAVVGVTRKPPGHRGFVVDARGLRDGPVLLDPYSGGHPTVHACRSFDIGPPTPFQLASGAGATGVVQMANGRQRRNEGHDSGFSPPRGGCQAAEPAAR